MKSNMWKSTLREIKQSLGRFMAILAIVALGVGLFSGLKVTQPAMIKTVNAYLTEKQFYDYRILSTLGFEQEDVDYLAGQEGIRFAEGVVSFDILCSVPGGNEMALKTYSLPDHVNGIELLAGRMPENARECLADSHVFSEESIGQTLTFSASNSEEDLEHFTETEYTIVGIVQSSVYIQFERGNTSLGNGRLSGFLYLPQESYDTDYYTEILVKFDTDYHIYSEAYDSFMEEKDASWEKISEDAAYCRYDRIMTDAENELADAEKELADGRAEGEEELADAKQELADAEKELKDGEQKLADARKELEDGRKELEDGREELLDAENEIACNEAKLNDGEAKLKENEALLKEKEAQAAEGRRQLEAGQAALDENRQRLEAAQEQLSTASSGLALLQTQLQQYQDAIAAGLLTPAEQEAMLSRLENGVRVLLASLQGEGGEGSMALADPDFDQRLSDLQNNITCVETIIEQKNTEVSQGLTQIDETQTELDTQRATLDAADVQLAEARKQLEAGWAEISYGRAQLHSAKDQVSEGWEELAEGEAELADGEAEIKKNEADLADGWQEYYDGLEEYEEGYQEFLDEIAEGEEKIADARKEVEDIEEPESYLLDRGTNVGYACFESDSSIVNGIANVFPVFFFAVAALICITTMSRMIEEQRTQIGVLKALGYSQAVIMGKYLFYSGAAAVLGCLIGFFGGTWLFPNVIWYAYGMMYDVGKLLYVFDWKLGLVSLIVSAACSVGTTFFTCRRELNEVAAELMRPKAPKAGKRVLLERVPFIWRRMKFLHKVSYRNVFRYRKRFLMMVFGISGCTALLVTGFGINDSVTNLASDQYEQIQVYDMSVTLKEGETSDTLRQLQDILEGQAESFIGVREKSMDLVCGEQTKSVYLVAAEEGESLDSYVHLLDAKKQAVSYPGDGECVLSEAAAKSLDIQEGDTITLQDENHHSMEVRVSGLIKNYIMNYVYLTRQTYEACMGEEASVNTVYVNLMEDTDGHQLSAELMKLDEVANVTITSDTQDRFASMMDSMGLVVAVIIVCAAGLAFIVLYNLTNINITERIREIATIKVLGFYKKETASYIFRENLILTFLGALLGLVLGKYFHMFVMSQIKVDQVAFDVRILPQSYVYSLLLTLLFAWFVNFVMGRKLERISMTESLKSVD